MYNLKFIIYRYETDNNPKQELFKSHQNPHKCRMMRMQDSEIIIETIKSIMKGRSAAMKTKVIAVSNNKGGSGKTTVTGNLAYTLMQNDKKVLLIDADMQINLTRSYDLKKNIDRSLYDALINERPLEEYIMNTKYENIDFIISDHMLSSIDMELFTKKMRETLFQRILRSTIESEEYDYILIDTSPFLGLLNYNILVASDYVLVPVELSAFGIEGLEPLTNFFEEARLINKDLQFLGIVETKVDQRESTTDITREILRDLFSDKILKSYIPIDINIKKSQFAAEPLGVFIPYSRAAGAYRELAKEVMQLVE